MIPVSSSYNIQGMPTLNFNNLLANTNQNQTTLPISALGNILQLHCNPSLTLQVNGPSSLIPVSTKDTISQDQINTLRSIFPNQQSYQNIPQQDQCTNTSPKGFNQLIQELLITYQSQQETLSQLTIKYNFLLNAMDRLLFDVQNNVEYSLLALGISQTINKVKLNQLNQLNQLNCPSFISNGIVPMISQSHVFNNCTQAAANQKSDTIPISSIIDLTHQRQIIDSMPTVVTMDKKHNETTFSDSSIISHLKPIKLTSLDKLDKLIDETVKKSSVKPTDNNISSISKAEDNQQSSVIDIHTNMGNAIHQIIRQFYQKASSSISINSNGFIDSTLFNNNNSVNKLQNDNLTSATNSFSQQVTEIFANSQLPLNTLTNRSNQSFILCNNVASNPLINGQNCESFMLSMNGQGKESNASIVAETFPDLNNTTEDTESISNREDEDMCFAELDPTEVATRIRDILSLHSIGQRLFAKHVLNLSQGTVSELLSKPKPWSKLSEKGRDSYRKMNQWSQDASKVQELKSIAPRKGFSGHYAGMSPATPIKEDQETQEKIKRILNDAKMAMASTNSQSNVDEEIFSCYAKPNEPPLSDALSDGSHMQTVATYCCTQPTVNTNNNNNNNVLEFDISQLQKKLTAALQSSMGGYSARHESLPQVSPAVSYQQSPLIVMNLANLVTGASSLVVPSMHTVYPSILPLVNANVGANTTENCQHNDNSFEFDRICSMTKSEPLCVMTESTDCGDGDKRTGKSFEHYIDHNFSADQLDDPKTKHPKSMTDLESFLKSFIGSIKLCENSVPNEEIKTAELVNVIKDHLTKNSISQRTFGCLLGLSQGTVSDILSRPKPWTSLTNKGREPYIRMLKYLLKPTYFKDMEPCSTDTNSHQMSLINIQSLPNSSSSPSSSDVALTYDHHLICSDDKSQCTAEDHHHDNQEECTISSSGEDVMDYQSWDEDTDKGSLDVCGSPIVSLDQLHKESVQYDDPKERIFGIATRMISLDTAALAISVKEVLNSHNLGQRLFGETILNLSQASVSDLLSKPKTWNQLSLKGREPYVRMQLWLQNPDRLHPLLKTCVNRKVTGETDSSQISDSNGLMPGNIISNTYNNNIRKINSKRTRVIFTDSQKSELRKIFQTCPYPKVDQCTELSTILNLSTATITNWFHNQRIRMRHRISTAENHNNCPSDIISGESEINSEKSAPITVDDIFETSDSDNSMSAPHLYPESGAHDRTDDDDTSGNYLAGTMPCSSLAGSNKRKRTNPIKLEMVNNKSTNKDSEERYLMNGDKKLRQS